MSNNIFEQYVNDNIEPLPSDIDQLMDVLNVEIDQALASALRVAQAQQVIDCLVKLHQLGVVSLDEMTAVIERFNECE